MRIKALIALVAILALCLPVQAADQQFVYKNAVLPAATTNIAFGFQATSVLVRNKNAVGGTVVYVDWTGAVASAVDDEVEGGAAMIMSGSVTSGGSTGGFGNIQVMCAVGTCDVIITAVR